jgi:hypothetical protein
MIKATIQKLLNSMGFDIVRIATNFARDEVAIIKRVKGLTATSPFRIVGLIDAVKYISGNRIEGTLVECGVWRGGSIIAALATLLDLCDTSREIYLFDTFEGMSPPNANDIMFDGTGAIAALQRGEKREGGDNYWCYASLESVRKSVLATGYPAKKIHFVKGKVEDTLPAQAPERIALLRLDTDWYESTKHELVHLYPRLAPAGVLIIDDYGHWKGARQAVDEYFATLPHRPFFSRLDYTGRLLIKPG